jgi:hypothetical protein
MVVNGQNEHVLLSSVQPTYFGCGWCGSLTWPFRHYIKEIIVNHNGWTDGWMDGWMDGWVDGWFTTDVYKKVEEESENRRMVEE